MPSAGASDRSGIFSKFGPREAFPEFAMKLFFPFFELCEALLLGILFLFRTRTVLEKALTCSTKDCSAAKVFQKFLGQRIDLEFS